MAIDAKSFFVFSIISGWIFLVDAVWADEAPRTGDKQDALKSIESTRGGRHWVDAKTDPPKSPEASRKCFQIEPGLRK